MIVNCTALSNDQNGCIAAGCAYAVAQCQPLATTTPATTTTLFTTAPAETAVYQYDGLGRRDCLWVCVDKPVRATAFAAHGMRLPYDAVCGRVALVDTFFAIIQQPTFVEAPVDCKRDDVPRGARC